ncbi:MAG TPA: prepilin-type N-terminal cleavage/methylation domain-containing protein, partial [Polyangiales bacterium]
MTVERSNMRRRDGFTLVELMIAMTIGLFVTGAAYYITRTTSRMFAEQLRRSETQLTLRSAVELMRRDIARAGFASVRSTGEMPGCTNTSNPLSGWAGTVGPAAIDVSPVALAAVWVEMVAGRPRLYLSGNFSTSDQYLLNSQNSAADRLVFQTDQYAFLRSFVMPTATGPVPANTFLPQRFTDAFQSNLIGRMVNVLDL